MLEIISLKTFIIFWFILCYFLIILSHKKINPAYVALAGAFGLLLLGVFSIRQALSVIDLNVLGIFWGTMVLSVFFIRSNVPSYLAAKLVRRCKTVSSAILALCVLSGFISSFTENVSTVLIVAPIAFEVARRLKINPAPFLIGVAVSSNLQGSATMIGDPPSIILAMKAKMNFLDFFWMQGKPGITFAVEIAAIASLAALYILFKRFKQGVYYAEEVKVHSWFPSILFGLKMAALAILGFFPDKPYYTLGFVGVFFGITAITWNKFSRRERISLIKDLDWQTFLFLVGIFILVGSLTISGVIEDISRLILNLSLGNKFVAYSLIVWVSVFLSAFIDNVPYTLAMIPVAKIIALNLNMNPYLLLFGVIIGATVGGNITPIGATANIVAVGQLRREGFKIGFLDFFKIGFPFTITATLAAYIFLWIIWS